MNITVEEALVVGSVGSITLAFLNEVDRIAMMKYPKNRWLRSIIALNLLLVSGRISRDTYWRLYKLCAMKFRSCFEYYRLLNIVHKRAGHVCEQCAVNNQLEMHHKKQLILFPWLGLVESNVVLLCGECHDAVTKEERRNPDFYGELRRHTEPLRRMEPAQTQSPETPAVVAQRTQGDAHAPIPGSAGPRSTPRPPGVVYGY